MDSARGKRLKVIGQRSVVLVSRRHGHCSHTDNVMIITHIITDITITVSTSPEAVIAHMRAALT